MNWETIKNIFDVLGYISTAIVIITLIAGVILWFRGIVPVLLRLGNGLSRRKIAIFAKGDTLTSLEDLLHDSKLFRKLNFIKVTSMDDLGRAEEATIFLVYWPDWKDGLPRILSKKVDGTALIIYAPYEGGAIPPETMGKLNIHRNVVVNNFRGRLLNDIIASMITTSYEKR